MSKVDGSGQRDNKGKVPLELISPSLLEGVGKVLEFGAHKYEKHNWRKGMNWSIVIGSLMRHLCKWISPFHSDFDEETELNHLYHVACNVMFLIEYETSCPALDDRFKYEAKLVGSDLTESDLDEMAEEELKKRELEDRKRRYYFNKPNGTDDL